MREWSNAYAYVNGHPCSSCAYFKLSERPERFLMIRPNGERRLTDDLQSQLEGTGIVVWSAIITADGNKWAVVVDVSGQDGIAKELTKAFEALEIDGIQDAGIVYAGNRQVVTFWFWI